MHSMWLRLISIILNSNQNTYANLSDPSVLWQDLMQMDIIIIQRSVKACFSAHMNKVHMVHISK